MLQYFLFNAESTEIYKVFVYFKQEHNNGDRIKIIQYGIYNELFCRVYKYWIMQKFPIFGHSATALREATQQKKQPFQKLIILLAEALQNAHNLSFALATKKFYTNQ